MYLFILWEFPNISYLYFYSLGEYVCEIETYGSPLDQTSTLEILGKCFVQYEQMMPIYQE